MNKFIVRSALALFAWCLAVAGHTAAFASEQSECKWMGGAMAASIGKYEEAVNLLQPEAERGCAVAQYFLGRVYMEDTYDFHDGGYAERWLRQAAVQGHAGAQAALGTLLAIGDGVVKDTASAYMWLLLAKANGDKNAERTMSIVQTRLSVEKKLEAEELAKTCLRSNYKQCN